MEDLKSFVTNLPGIDEAMALSSVLNFIDGPKSTDAETSEAYDIIVFDTAPTGHTLRLLQLPSVLKIGLKKLTSWKARFASVFSTVTSMLYNDPNRDAQQQRLKRLEERMAAWLDAVTRLTNLFKDNTKTQFVCVCNASFLSVYETKRLISELKVARIHCEYILVNMLMPRMLAQLSKVEAENKSLVDNVKQVLNSSGVVDQTVSEAIGDAVELCGGVSRMQEHYLQVLHSEVNPAALAKGESLVKLILLPLLAGEVRGVANLGAFSERLVNLDPKLNVSNDAKTKLKEFSQVNLNISSDERLTYVANTTARLMNKKIFQDEEVVEMDLETKSEEKDSSDFALRDKVEIFGLQKKTELNGKHGVIFELSTLAKNGRIGVEVINESGKKSRLLLKPVNLKKFGAEAERKNKEEGFNLENVTPEMMALVQGVITMPGGIQKLLNHKLVKEMKASNDKQMKNFFNDIESNGLFAGLKYLSDKYVMSKLAKVAKEIKLDQ